MIVQTLPGWFLIVALLFYSHKGIPWLIWVLSSAGLAFGIASLVAFGPRDALGAPVQPVKPARISGDGTNPLLDGLFWTLQICGYYLGTYLWHRWAESMDLDSLDSLHWWLAWALSILTVVALHETGHAVVGLALGMRLRSLLVGPFQGHIEDGRWKFRFHLPGVFFLGGAAGVVPSSTRPNRGREIAMIAAGPAINLITGGIACLLALKIPDTLYDDRWWQPLALFGTISLVVFAANLIPFRPQMGYSDGARIYQLLRGGPLVDLQRTFNLTSATLVTPLRPRDYDLEAIQRATIAFTQGYQGLLLRLIESEYFFDNSLFPEAARALAEGEAMYPAVASIFPVQQHTIFVIGSAYLRQDAAAARQWWERMEAKRPKVQNSDYWLAKSALHWIEGCPTEAAEAWNKGDELVKRLRPCGSAEFDRHRYDLLRREIDAPLKPEFTIPAESEVSPGALAKLGPSMSQEWDINPTA
jgi:Zn-dependent protease